MLETAASLLLCDCLLDFSSESLRDDSESHITRLLLPVSGPKLFVACFFLSTG